MNERVMALAGFHHNVAAASAIAAGRPAARDELLPAEVHASVATVAGLDPNDRFITKHAVYIDCTGEGGDSPRGAVDRAGIILKIFAERFLFLWVLSSLRQG